MKKFNENKELEYSSVQKAILILLSFIPDNEPMGNLQLSKSLGLNKSTVSRLMQVLVHYQLIQQDEVTKKYELGRTAAQLGMAVEVSQTDRLVEIARPYIEHLRDVVGESVCLEVLSSGQAKVVTEAVGPPPLSVSFPESLPMHVSAGAKVILAYSDRDYVDSVINGKFQKITDNTITDTSEFKKQLEEIREHGIAFDHGENNADVHAVSTAVFNHLQKPVAAMAICTPSNRINKITSNYTIELLKRSTKMISERLYYEGTEE